MGQQGVFDSASVSLEIRKTISGMDVERKPSVLGTVRDRRQQKDTGRRTAGVVSFCIGSG